MATLSALTQIPENTSFVQPTKFTFTFPQLPFLRYFSQTATIPGVSTSEITVPTPFVNTFRHGEKLSYETFTINALVDEDLRVWQESYDWLVALTKPTRFEEYKRFKSSEGSLYHDAFLTINTNANLPNIRFKFKDCHPLSMGSLAFSSADNADTTMTLDITFRYDYFELERI